jgi:hypothetical protein
MGLFCVVSIDPKTDFPAEKHVVDVSFPSSSEKFEAKITAGEFAIMKKLDPKETASHHAMVDSVLKQIVGR